MSAFAPDLSHYWLSERAATDRAATDRAVAPPTDDEPAALAVLKELESLVERVNAARSIF